MVLYLQAQVEELFIVIVCHHFDENKQMINLIIYKHTQLASQPCNMETYCLNSL